MADFKAMTAVTTARAKPKYLIVAEPTSVLQCGVGTTPGAILPHLRLSQDDLRRGCCWQFDPPSGGIVNDQNSVCASGAVGSRARVRANLLASKARLYNVSGGGSC